MLESQHSGGRARQIYEFKANLVYKASSNPSTICLEKTETKIKVILGYTMRPTEIKTLSPINKAKEQSKNKQRADPRRVSYTSFSMKFSQS